MLTIEQLRSEQERRLLLAIEPLKEARKNLQEAILLAEARQREFYDISNDIHRKIKALELVATMNKEISEEVLPAEQRPEVIHNKAGNTLADRLQAA